MPDNLCPASLNQTQMMTLLKIRPITKAIVKGGHQQPVNQRVIRRT
jgi:hypothetical protein